jgi:DNA-directed RNA polymerase specialized sigma24 family protein
MAAESVALAPPDDATLAVRAGAGDRSAFDELYDRHASYIASVVFRLNGDEELPDLVQETFLAALESMHRLRRPESDAFADGSGVARGGARCCAC